jgi:hypothetical protein
VELPDKHLKKIMAHFTLFPFQRLCYIKTSFIKCGIMRVIFGVMSLGVGEIKHQHNFNLQSDVTVHAVTPTSEICSTLYCNSRRHNGS